MKIIPFNTFKHLEYVRSVLMVPISSATRGLIAIDTDGKPQGVVLLDNWTENSCMGHIAIQHPMALRKLHVEAMEFVFNTCQLGMFLGVIPADLPKSFKLNLHLGFKEIYRLKDGWDVGVDCIIVQLLKENCKYINRIKEVA